MSLAYYLIRPIILGIFKVYKVPLQFTVIFKENWIDLMLLANF